MSTYLSPGLYVKETDFSFYVKAISTSACAMIGVAEKGPLNKATLVTSWEQFVRKFGGYLANSYLAYAARQFFDNGGQVLWVTRIAHYTDITDRATATAVAASKTVNDRSATPQPTLKIEAVDPGSHGEGIGFAIEAGDSTAAFTLKVYEKVGEQAGLVEAWPNLSLDEDLANHCEQAVNEKSELVTLTDLDSPSASPVDLPALTGGVVWLEGGDDGLTGLADADYVGDSASHTGLYALDEVDALNMVVLPGVTSGSVIHSALAYCEKRKDCLIIVDAPLGLEPQDVVEFRKGQGAYAESHGAFASSYGGMYWPWLEISDPLTGKRKLIPPSGSVAGCFARSDQKVAVWAAPAGIDRGRIFGVTNLEYKTSQGERDVLYPEGINVIASFPDSGITIWGQKTLQSQPSATDRVNVRRLMMYVEESVAASGRFAVFEPSLERTWRSLERLINPFMQDAAFGVRDKAKVTRVKERPPPILLIPFTLPLDPYRAKRGCLGP